MLPPSLSQILTSNTALILIVLALLVLILLLLLVWTNVRLGRLNRMYRRLTRGTSGGNLEEILAEYMQTVTRVDQQTNALDAQTRALQETQRNCLQRIGLVRFDAFEDVGGEQSFAVAVLDDRRNGVVVSSVYSRMDVRVYAKALKEGQPSHQLTDEEARAVALAEKRQ